MGLAVDDGGDAPAAAPAASANAPATTAAAAPAVKAPVPIPASEEPPPPPPDTPWVAAAKERSKVPYWVMPVLIFLPVWLIMYVGTLEEPAREEGVLFTGGQVYAANCASCHGAAGGGGVGPAFTNGAVISTFAQPESMVAWVGQGSSIFREAGRTTYGDTEKPIGGNNGSLMPAFAERLTARELIAAVFYERINHGGAEDELPLAEAMYEAMNAGELDGGTHFVEGPDGDLDGTGEISEFFAEIREMVGGEEVAAE